MNPVKWNHKGPNTSKSGTPVSVVVECKFENRFFESGNSAKNCVCLIY